MDPQPKPKDRKGDSGRIRSLKQIKVVIAAPVLPSYVSLLHTRTSGVASAIERLKRNPAQGIHIPRHLMPKKYLREYAPTNLWKLNLPEGWRLMYTLQGTSDEIIVLVIGILNHKEYERLFKY